MQRFMFTPTLPASAVAVLLIVVTTFQSWGQSGSVTQSIPGPVCAGTTVQFVYSGGCPSGSLSWGWDSGAPILGTISSNGSLANVTFTSAGGTTIMARCNSNPSLTGATSGLVVQSSGGTPSVSITGPTNFCAGLTVLYEASPVNGGSSPAYQWKVNGNVVQNGSSYTYSTNSLVQGDVVTVVMLSNKPCVTAPTATSNTITIGTLTQPSPVSVSISDPGPRCNFSGYSFQATPTNGGINPTYTWYRNGSAVTDNQSSGSNYTPFYTLQNGETIRCQMENNQGGCLSNNPAWSDPVTISTTSPVTPTVSISPNKMSICQGESITFSASASHPLTGSYTWSLGGVPQGSGPTFTITNFQSQSTYNVTLQAGVSGSCLTTNFPSTTFNATSIAVNPVPTASASPQTICSGQQTSLSITSDIPGTTYTYTVNWTTGISGALGGSGSLPGTISQTLTNSTASSGTATYHITPSKGGCSGGTIHPVVTVNPIPPAASATIPTPPLICAGQNLTFQATPVNGGSQPTYVWYRNGSVATDNQTPGNVYTPHNTLQNGEKIKCQIWPNISCAVAGWSNEVTVSVQSPTNPSASISYSPPIVCEGQSVTFSASSPQTITSYQWKINSSAPMGSGSTFTTSALHPGDVVHVTVGVSGFCLSSNTVSASTSANLTVRPMPTATITPVGSKIVCSGCTEVIASYSEAGYSHQWLKNGSPLPGETTLVYTASSSGTYACNVTLNGCTKTSGTLQLTVNTPPVANGGADQYLVYPTRSVTLNGSGTDVEGGITSYQWTQLSGPGTTLSNAATANLFLPDLTEGTYVFLFVVRDDLIESSQPDEVTVTVSSPPNNYNWVKETEVLVSGIYNKADVNALQIQDSEKAVSMTYLDGLGRTMQVVNERGSPAGKDVVKPLVYDALGREPRKYLPVVPGETNGFYKDNTTLINPATGDYAGIAANFYNNPATKIADDQNKPFAETAFELSPLNRIMKQGAPGGAWQPNSDPWSTEDKAIKKRYQTNQSQEVLLFTYDVATGSARLSSIPGEKYYPPNRLNVQVTIDENNNEVIEYKDRSNRAVCKKFQYTVKNGVKQYASTYYLYDDFGNLIVVLPPEAINHFPGN